MGSCALPGNFRRRPLLSPANRQDYNNGENELFGHRYWHATGQPSKVYRKYFSSVIYFLRVQWFKEGAEIVNEVSAGLVQRETRFLIQRLQS